MHRRRVHPEECEEEDDRKQAEEDKVHNSPPSGGYKCGLCDFTATVGYLMAAHVKKEHKGYKKCKRCNQVSISNKIIKRHSVFYGKLLN